MPNGWSRRSSIPCCRSCRSKAWRRVDDDQLGVRAAAIVIAVRLLGAIADRIAGLQHEAAVADHELDLPFENVGNFLALVRDKAAAAAARRDVVNAPLEQMGLVIGDQTLERQPGAVAQGVGVDDRALAGP